MIKEYKKTKHGEVGGGGGGDYFKYFHQRGLFEGGD